MHIKDILKLSFKNLKIHFWRNLALMVIISVIFVLIFTMNLWLQGLENTYQRFARKTTNGEVVILAHNDLGGYFSNEQSKIATEEEIILDIKQYNGVIIGDNQTYNGHTVLAANLINEATKGNLSNTPEGYIPVITAPLLGLNLLKLDSQYTTKAGSVQEKSELYRNYRDKILNKTFIDEDGARYYVVGLTSSGFGFTNLSINNIDRKNHSLLNPILEMIPLPNENSLVLTAKDNLNDDILDENVQQPSIKMIVAMFVNDKDACRYFESGHGYFGNTTLQKRHSYSVSVIAGMPPEAQFVFQILKMIALAIGATLVIIALIVIIFTSIRLVDQDRKNIVLYYNLGATRSQVKKIYFCYFLWLVVGALILALSIAVVITLGYSALNSETLSVLFMTAFSLTEQPQIILCDFNMIIYCFAIILLFSPVFCIIFNKRQLNN